MEDYKNGWRYIVWVEMIIIIKLLDLAQMDYHNS